MADKHKIEHCIIEFREAFKKYKTAAEYFLKYNEADALKELMEECIEARGRLLQAAIDYDGDII